MTIARKGLQELDGVAWSSLRTASGTADHVPLALAQLAASTFGTALHDSYWALDNVIVLQGTVYESAYAAVPFIIDILVSTKTDDVRAAAYDLLIEIATGVSDPTHPHVVLASGVTADLVEACKQLIRTAIPHYTSDLLGSDSGLRRRSLDLVFALREDPTVLAELLHRVDPGDDDDLRSELADALACLSRREG